LAEGLKYDRPRKRPEYLDGVQVLDLQDVDDVDDVGGALLALLGSPNVASKAWVFEQYDHMVRHGTVVRPGQASSGVVRVFRPDGKSSKGVAISAGCNSRYVYLDPVVGSELAVASAYADLIAVGAKPLATTDCLNFGNPENPQIMWQFAESIKGLGEACRALDTPIVSGNVSLYNETDGEAIKPTPMIAMVGLLDDASTAITSCFKSEGDVIAVVGELGGVLGGSEYLHCVHGKEQGRPQAFEPAQHKKCFEAVRRMIEKGLLQSAEDISDGGLLCCVAECCIKESAAPIGATLGLPKWESRLDELLFGEGPARFVVSMKPEKADEVARVAGEASAGFLKVGRVGGRSLELRVGGEDKLNCELESLASAFHQGFLKVP
jgi:phosphoribosylformylglycinamidine synthase